jgi:Velvet factor.
VKRGSAELTEKEPDLMALAERKPIDPPPVVQLRVREEGTYLAQ